MEEIDRLFTFATWKFRRRWRNFSTGPMVFLASVHVRLSSGMTRPSSTHLKSTTYEKTCMQMFPKDVHLPTIFITNLTVSGGDAKDFSSVN